MSNLEGNPTDAFAEGNLALSDPVRDPPKRKKAQPPVHADEERTTIVLEDNEQIPPTGQFFGVNGVGYILRSGEPARVPNSLLNVLDTAIVSVPVVNAEKTVIGYRDRLRFPYRIVTDRRKAD